MTRLQLLANQAPDGTSEPEAILKRYVYGRPDAPVHRATVSVTVAEYRQFIRRPRSARQKAILFAKLLGRCGLSADAVVCLWVAFTFDPEDVARLLRTAVRSVRVPSGLGDSREDLRAEAYVHLWRNGVPALARVRRTDPLRYLRRMTKTFYRAMGRAKARAHRNLAGCRHPRRCPVASGRSRTPA